MVKLDTIVREVLEGAKVTFDNKKATAIDIDIKDIEGEQLGTYNGSTTKHGYTIYYSLVSDPKGQRIKAAQDALKYDSNLIKPKELKALINSTLRSELSKIDYIVYLESEGKLNALLASIIKELYPGAEIVYAEKIEYSDLKKAINWDSLKRQTEQIKQAVMAWLKKAEEEKVKKIRKSNKIRSTVARHLYSKYNFGLHPSGEGEKEPPVYRVLIDCLTKNKTMLIVDDNMYTGDDLYKIFQHIEKIKNFLIKNNLEPDSQEVQAFEELEKWKIHKNVSKSKFIQDKIKELELVKQAYYNRVSIMNQNLNDSLEHFFGYVLYKLEAQDIKSV